MHPIPLGPGAEFNLIRRFLEREGIVAPRTPADVRVGPGDDCAVVAGDGIAVSTDLSVEGIHFRREWLASDEIGFRAAAAGLSDLAAVAARPIGVLVSLALPETDVADPAVRLMDGVQRAADAAGAVLLGGDVVGSPGPLVVDVVVVGEASRPVLRTGALAGDELWVTGALGAAASAVACWNRSDAPPPAAREAFASPPFRHAEARWLAEQGVLHALIDLSDGLASDARHVAAASGVALTLEAEHVPVHPVARVAGSTPEAALRLALAGGEDYELLFTAAPGTIEPLIRPFADRFGLRLGRVGTVQRGHGISLRQGGTERPLTLRGFGHLEGETS